jgi:glycosyltransferase involved in cell wall biosynthesis
MLFSIVTPSFRSSQWLKLCIASVADQDVPLEHIVQDSLSDDGTMEWLPHDKRVRAYLEKDKGMYDAINRGFQRATGEFAAWLNCDEQYLPGTLRRVADFFRDHPAVDVLFGDVVVVDAAGNYLYHRKMQTPLLHHTWTCHLSTLSCGTFFRRRIVSESGFQFDPKLRDVGDGEWMIRLLRVGLKMATLRQFTSVFTQTGANMSASPNAARERRELLESAPFLAQKTRRLLILHHRLRRLLGGMYSQKPFDYAIFTTSSPERRMRFHVSQPVSTGGGQSRGDV